MGRASELMNGYSNGTGTKETIRAIEGDIARHQTNLNELYAKFETIGRTNWQIILSAVGVLVVAAGGLWALTSTPIDRDLRRLEANSALYERRLSQLEAIFARQDADLAAIRHRADAQYERIKEGVSSKEFNAALAASVAQRESTQRSVDALNKKIDDVFPPQKTLEDLTRRLAELERTRALQNLRQ